MGTPQSVTHEPRSVGIEQVPWRPVDVVWAILMATFGILLLNGAVLGVSILAQTPLRENGIVLAAMVIAQDVIVVGSALVFSLVRYRVGWDRLGLRSFSVPMGCALSLALLMASYISRAVYAAVALGLGFHIAEQQVLSQLELNGVGFLFTLFAVAFIAPVAEEVFFRGFMYQGLAGRMGKVAAALVSNFLFASLHLSVELFIPIFMLGLFLAWLYEQTRSLYPGILLHAANNGLALLFLFLLQQAGWRPS